VQTLEGAAPGAAGHVRVRYGTKENLADATSTDWATVGAERDYSHQFILEDLKPATVYHFAAETRTAAKVSHAPLRGRFETAPPAKEYGDITFTVITGQAYKDIDHPDGYHIYPAMQALKPKFIVPTGDTVYYDSDPPRAVSQALARYHWDRMYSLPRHIAFHLQVPGYWEKDDHDAWMNDCWPGMDSKLMGQFTFPQGLQTFRDEVPMGDKLFRTFRWGKGLQVWVVEGRDFRSPNSMKDGPAKTIWGAEQKQWFKDSVKASDADWKVLISPTPLIGPDRAKGKNDNHSNAAFQTEGDELRQWIMKHAPDNFFICCGDRHWQYHSVHPETQVHEFSCGPASDVHAGGSPGLEEKYHRFHRVKGGFLSVNTAKADGDSRITFRFHDVNGKQVYEYERSTAAK
jgi:alkaline phosphatase D